VQWAPPRRSRLFVASSEFEPCRTVQSRPFSACRLPTGTTWLELVMSADVWQSRWPCWDTRSHYLRWTFQRQPPTKVTRTGAPIER
jgi:hypothetical protein